MSVFIKIGMIFTGVFGISSLFCFSGASDIIREKVPEKFEFVFIEDNRLPLYDLLISFSEGAISDAPHFGVADMAFSLLKSGTSKYSQKELSEKLDFLGLLIDSDVTHEYSTLTMSGLVKDQEESVKLLCHMVNEVTFPENEVDLYKKQLIHSLENSLSSPSSLASLLFRTLTFKDTPYEKNASGTLSSVPTLTSSQLVQKWHFFRTVVPKRVYVIGPKKSRSLKDIIARECHFKQDEKKEKKSLPPLIAKTFEKKPLYFIPLPNSNQAEIRVGRFLQGDDIANKEILTLISSYLGDGGMSSKLMSELRVKRGLTYGVMSAIASQKNYGRIFIASSTKTSSVVELLKVLFDQLKITKDKTLLEGEVSATKDYLSGRYLFAFEKREEYLKQLMLLDHLELSYERLYNYPALLKPIQVEEFSQKFNNLFDDNKLITVVLGPKSLEQTLKKEMRDFEVITLAYKDLL